MKQYLAYYRWRTDAGQLMDTMRPISAKSKAEAVRIAKSLEGRDGMTWYRGVEGPNEGPPVEGWINA